MGDEILTEELLFWDKWTRLLPLYEALRRCLTEAYPDMRIQVSKSQISFYNKHMFAMVSPPVRRRKDWPKEFMLLSFGLPYPIASPRIAICTEAYPNRWTHHVLIEDPASIDEALLGWIDQAYAFSAGKR